MTKIIFFSLSTCRLAIFYHHSFNSLLLHFSFERSRVVSFLYIAWRWKEYNVVGPWRQESPTMKQCRCDAPRQGGGIFVSCPPERYYVPQRTCCRWQISMYHAQPGRYRCPDCWSITANNGFIKRHGSFSALINF